MTIQENPLDVVAMEDPKRAKNKLKALKKLE
jgi:hypothetical protein